MVFSENDQVIGALASNRADDSLGVRVLPGRLRCGVVVQRVLAARACRVGPSSSSTYLTVRHQSPESSSRRLLCRAGRPTPSYVSPGSGILVSAPLSSTSSRWTTTPGSHVISLPDGLFGRDRRSWNVLPRSASDRCSQSRTGRHVAFCSDEVDRA